MIEQKRQIRILIADDQGLLREALSSVLAGEPDIMVAGVAVNGEEAIEAAQLLAPDIILLNPWMRGEEGMVTLRALVAAPGRPRIVIFGDCTEKQQIIEALRCGAHGILPLQSSPQLLFKSLRAVAAGEYWVCHQSVCDLIEYVRAAGAPAQEDAPTNGRSLTPREIDVIASVVDGCTNREIAGKLEISEQTVKHHLTSIFNKVGVTNRLELALYAMHMPLR
jgi:two-component system, NarL family, nitrate/nitrite response regulator NarL